jgi:hypothetical protein
VRGARSHEHRNSRAARATSGAAGDGRLAPGRWHRDQTAGPSRRCPAGTARRRGRECRPTGAEPLRARPAGVQGDSGRRGGQAQDQEGERLAAQARGSCGELWRRVLRTSAAAASHAARTQPRLPAGLWRSGLPSGSCCGVARGGCSRQRRQAPAPTARPTAARAAAAALLQRLRHRAAPAPPRAPSWRLPSPPLPRSCRRLPSATRSLLAARCGQGCQGRQGCRPPPAATPPAAARRPAGPGSQHYQAPPRARLLPAFRARR